jgi:adenylate cyclase
MKVLERHNKLICESVEKYGGHVVKSQGDGFMIAFGDAGQAVLCCVDVQRALNDSDRWGDIRVRIGIHMGAMLRRGNDLFGRNVALAARVAGQASGGEILVSESVRAALDDGALDVQLGNPREVDLKGLVGSHKVYTVKLPI